MKPMKIKNNIVIFAGKTFWQFHLNDSAENQWMFNVNMDVIAGLTENGVPHSIQSG